MAAAAVTIKLTAILVTKNEAGRVRRCLESLRWADEIVVVDQSSDDGTVDICREFAAKVYVVEPKGYCEPDRPLAASKAKNDWVLYLDADEVVPPQLREEIRLLLSATPAHNSYYVPRKNIFLGKWIKGSGWYPGYVLRLFKKGYATFSEKIHTDLTPVGSPGYLKLPLEHYTCDNLKDYIRKSGRYSGILARQAYEKGERLDYKNCIWKLVLLPFAYAFQKFVLKRGFVDGFRGLVIAFLTMMTVFRMNVLLWKIQKAAQATAGKDG